MGIVLFQPVRKKGIHPVVTAFARIYQRLFTGLYTEYHSGSGGIGGVRVAAAGSLARFDDVQRPFAPLLVIAGLTVALALLEAHPTLVEPVAGILEGRFADESVG